MDSGSDFAEDVAMARIAGSKSGKYKDKLLRPENIKIDSDFYGERHLQEREKAVFAKFSQNADLGEILRLTKDAKLVKYVAKKPAEPDTILMKVRQVLDRWSFIDCKNKKIKLIYTYPFYSLYIIINPWIHSSTNIR